MDVAPWCFKWVDWMGLDIFVWGEVKIRQTHHYFVHFLWPHFLSSYVRSFKWKYLTILLLISTGASGLGTGESVLDVRWVSHLPFDQIKWPSGGRWYAPNCETPGVSAWGHRSSVSIPNRERTRWSGRVCLLAVVSTWFNKRMAGGPVYRRPDMELRANPVLVGFGRCRCSAATWARARTIMVGT